MAADGLFKLFTKVHVGLFRLTRGKGMSTVRGMPILLLTTVGRKTNKPRTTPLMFIRDGADYVITASNSGGDKHPAWFLNLQASPAVQIETGGEKLQVSATIAGAPDRARLWSVLIGKAPFFEGYQKGTARQIPMVILRRR